MDVASTREDEVARALASRSFSRHVAFDDIGALDVEAMGLIRQSVIRVWEDAGSPPGALHRAATLGTELPRLIAEDKASAGLQAEGVSRAREIALAEQASAFLTALAAEIDTPPQ